MNFKEVDFNHFSFKGKKETIGKMGNKKLGTNEKTRGEDENEDMNVIKVDEIESNKVKFGGELMDNWIEVKDRVPSAEDVGGEDGLTIVQCADGKTRTGHWWVIADNPQHFVRWKPFSKE